MNVAGEYSVTVGEIVDAIEKNGYEHITGEYVIERENGTYAACAVGQAALNLDMPWNVIIRVLDDVIIRRLTTTDGLNYDRLGSFIIRLNDVELLPLNQIVERVRALNLDLNQRVTVPVFEWD